MPKKFHSALAELSDPSGLEASLRLFYSQTPKQKRDSSGVDDISINKIGKKNPAFIKQLSDSLRNNGVTYKLDPLRVFPLEKPQKNAYRIICIPTVKDRFVQRTLLDFLANKAISFETPISYGDHGSRSVKVAIKKAQHLRASSPWVYKTDITGFFDNIDREKMKAAVRSKLRYTSLYPIIFEAIDAEITNSVTGATKKILNESGIKHGRGLRQGLPLSPLLSNIYLGEFDRKVKNLGYKAIRYVDDLAFFCESEAECREIHDFCTSELKSNFGLEIPPLDCKGSKSKIYKPDEGSEFLGLVLVKDSTTETYKLVISDSQISRTFEKFKEYCDINLNLSKGIMFSQLSSKLEALIHSYKGHYGEAENYENFRNKLYYWRRKVYTKLIQAGLKVKDVEDLEHNARVFFHLTDVTLRKNRAR